MDSQHEPTLAERCKELAETLPEYADELQSLADDLNSIAHDTPIHRVLGLWARARRRFCEITGERII